MGKWECGHGGLPGRVVLLLPLPKIESLHPPTATTHRPLASVPCPWGPLSITAAPCAHRGRFVFRDFCILFPSTDSLIPGRRWKITKADEFGVKTSTSSRCGHTRVQGDECTGEGKEWVLRRAPESWTVRLDSEQMDAFHFSTELPRALSKYSEPESPAGSVMRFV